MAYHPQGDGIAERFNRSLLQFLRSYTQQEADWEVYLPLALFAFRTAVHLSTGVSPFEMIFGRAPKPDSFHPELSSSYQAQLRAKPATLQDFVEAHMVEKDTAQKTSYDSQSTTTHSFNIGDIVWPSQPTAGKLDPRWDGSWIVKSIHSPVTLQITNDKLEKLLTSINYVTEYNQSVRTLFILIHLLQLTLPGVLLRSHTLNLSNYLNPEDTLFVSGGNQIDFIFKTRVEFSEERASVVTVVTD